MGTDVYKRQVYVFHGEETYLREYYLDQLRKKLIPAGFEEFNYHKLEGKALSVQALSDICLLYTSIRS